MAVTTLTSLLITITSSTSSLSIILSLESLGNLWKLPCPIHSTRKCQEIGADSVTRPLGSKPCQLDAGCPLLLPAGRANTSDGDDRGGGGATIFAKLTKSLIGMALHNCQEGLDSTAVSIFVDIVVELTNFAVFVNTTNTTTKNETAMLFKRFEHKTRSNQTLTSDHTDCPGHPHHSDHSENFD